MVTIGRFCDTQLKWCLAFQSYWLTEWAIPASNDEEDIALVTVALKLREQGGNPYCSEFWKKVDAALAKRKEANETN